MLNPPRMRQMLSVLALLAGCEAHVDVLREATNDQGPREAGPGTGSGGAPQPTPDTGPPPLKDSGPPPLKDSGPPPLKDSGPPPLPDVIPPPQSVVFSDVAAGEHETCGVAGGVLYCWGRTASGRERLVPEPVEPAAVWRRVSNGSGAHCAERTTGSVYCFGANDEGQLGQGDTTASEEPVRVTLPAPAQIVQGRMKSFCSVLETGALHCWGANEEGQLAQDDPFPGDGVDRYLPVRVGADTDWTAVDVGQGHGCGIRTGGFLYCWGRNTKGESGLGEGSPGQTRTPNPSAVPTSWTAIATGANNTCGLRTPGALFCTGIGEYGALGLGSDRKNRFTPTQVGTFEDWIAIDVDTFHACGIRAPGTLWCWGRNIEGQLGTGDTEIRDVPTRAGDFDDWEEVTTGPFHTCARRRGTVWCTGDNEDGRLGTGDLDRRNVFTEIEPPPPPVTR